MELKGNRPKQSQKYLSAFGGFSPAILPSADSTSLIFEFFFAPATDFLYNFF